MIQRQAFVKRCICTDEDCNARHDLGISQGEDTLFDCVNLGRPLDISLEYGTCLPEDLFDFLCAAVFEGGDFYVSEATEGSVDRVHFIHCLLWKVFGSVRIELGVKDEYVVKQNDEENQICRHQESSNDLISELCQHLGKSLASPIHQRDALTPRPEMSLYCSGTSGQSSESHARHDIFLVGT